jgi:hypothetical protein
MRESEAEIGIPVGQVEVPFATNGSTIFHVRKHERKQ